MNNKHDGKGAAALGELEMYDATQERDVFVASLPFMEAAKALAVAQGMNDHGPLHAQRVYAFARQLGVLAGLSLHERALLEAAALLHDIGMSGDREQHHIISDEIVRQLTTDGKLPFNGEEADVVATLCKWHRREYDPDCIHKGLKIRTGLLATLLRLADCMDLDYRRGENFTTQESVIARVHQGQAVHHISVRGILGVRIHVSQAGTELQLLVNQMTDASLQLNRLIEELVKTPVAWPVKIIPLRKQIGSVHFFTSARKAVVFSYCNAHGFIQSGLSKRGLEMMGFSVDVVCDWKRTANPADFWKNTFETWNFSDINYIVVLGLNVSENIDLFLKKVKEYSDRQWTYATPLELKTETLKALVDVGVDVILSDARLLFAGAALEEHAQHWIKIAGLCNADDWLISSGGFEREDFQAARGLKHELFNLINSKAAISEYSALVDKIASGTIDAFVRQEPAWSKALNEHMPDIELCGRVVILGPIPMPGRFTYDFAHLAIETQGVNAWEQNEFSTPFAICRRPLDDGRERVLYVSRFSRLENAIPVKYFVPYQADQVGSGATIWHTYPSTKLATEAITATVGRINKYFKCKI